MKMNIVIKIAIICGAIISIIGIFGTFMRMSSNDGALALTGAVFFSAGIIAGTIGTRK